MKVTSDLHVIQALAAQSSVVFFSLGVVGRVQLGPLPFWASFLAVEAFKVSTCFFFALLNVSAALQIAIIMDIREVSDFKKRQLMIQGKLQGYRTPL